MQCNGVKNRNIRIFWIIEYYLGGGSSKHILRISVFLDTIFNIAEAQLTLKLLENSIFFRIFYGIFHNNRKNIHNFLKYYVSNELCQVLLKSKYFSNSYEAFLLFNLANVFLCFGTTMCHFILEKNLLPPNWMVNQKKSLLERSKKLKKPYGQKLYFKVVILSKYAWTIKILWVIEISWLIQRSSGLKPDWVLSRRLFSIINPKIASKTSFLKYVEHTGSNDTGR